MSERLVMSIMEAWAENPKLGSKLKEVGMTSAREVICEVLFSEPSIDERFYNVGPIADAILAALREAGWVVVRSNEDLKAFRAWAINYPETIKMVDQMLYGGPKPAASDAIPGKRQD